MAAAQEGPGKEVWKLLEQVLKEFEGPGGPLWEWRGTVNQRGIRLIKLLEYSRLRNASRSAYRRPIHTPVRQFPPRSRPCIKAPQVE